MLNKLKLITDIALFCNDKVLLVKYKDLNKYDHEKGWFLPDDELKSMEHPEDAIIRVTKEQLNLRIDSPSLEQIESFTGHDNTWHMVFHYKLKLGSMPELYPSEHIEEISWFDLDNLPQKVEVAHHGWALFTIEEMLNNSKTQLS